MNFLDEAPVSTAAVSLSRCSTDSRAGAIYRAIVSRVCALAVAGFFLYAAKSKIAEPRQFVFDILNYQMMPKRYVHLMAIFLPWWEVGAAIGLIIPRTRRAGAALIVAMLMMFMTAVVYAAFYKGYNIHCGCFGKNSAEAGWTTILLDVGLLCWTMASVIACRRPDTPPVS